MPVDDFGLEEADHRFGQGIVIAVSDAADRGLDAGLGETLGGADADVLPSAIGMMHEPALCEGMALMKGLFQNVEHEAGIDSAGDPPAYDPPNEGVDDEGDVDGATSGGDIGEVT